MVANRGLKIVSKPFLFSDKRQEYKVTPESVRVKKSRNSVFIDRKFYLDLKPKALTSPVVKQVLSDLRQLGGVILIFNLVI